MGSDSTVDVPGVVIDLRRPLRGRSVVKLVVSWNYDRSRDRRVVIESIFATIESDDIDVVSHRVDSPTPRAFGLSTLSASDVVLAEDESAVLQAFHERVMTAIEGDAGE